MPATARLAGQLLPGESRAPIAAATAATRHRHVVLRRPRRSVLVLVAPEGASDLPVRRLATSLAELGVQTVFLGREPRAGTIAAVAVDQQADSVDVCLAGAGGVLLLRELLRELIRLGRRDVSIVVHRVR